MILPPPKFGTTWHRIDAQTETPERDQVLVSRSDSCVPARTLISGGLTFGFGPVHAARHQLIPRDQSIALAGVAALHTAQLGRLILRLLGT